MVVSISSNVSIEESVWSFFGLKIHSASKVIEILRFIYFFKTRTHLLDRIKKLPSSMKKINYFYISFYGRS